MNTLLTGLIIIGSVGLLLNNYPGLKEVGLMEKLTILLVIANFVLALVTFWSVDVARKGVNLAEQANKRSEQLFIAEDRPLIDVTPIGVVQSPDGRQTLTALSVANYSGFKAYDIGIDLKYGEYGWIGEWVKADSDRQKKGNAIGIERSKPYLSPPKPQLPELDPGKTEYDQTGARFGLQGDLNLEELVCGAKEGLPVLIRVTWRNEKQHIFDEIYRYRLVCSKVSGGRSFTFLPEGIQSHKVSNISEQRSGSH